MKKLALSACLLLLILADGRPSKLGSASKVQLTQPENMAFQAAPAKMLHQARLLREKGEYGKAAELFQQGYRDARLRKDRHSEAHFLLGIANCHFFQHHYREALQEYLAAKEVLFSSIEPNSLIAINA